MLEILIKSWNINSSSSTAKQIGSIFETMSLNDSCFFSLPVLGSSWLDEIMMTRDVICGASLKPAWLVGQNQSCCCFCVESIGSSESASLCCVMSHSNHHASCLLLQTPLRLAHKGQPHPVNRFIAIYFFIRLPVFLSGRVEESWRQYRHLWFRAGEK